MRDQIVKALDVILHISFIIFVLVCAFAGASYNGSFGFFIGGLAGIFIGTIATGTVFVLISINANLEEIKSITKKIAITMTPIEPTAIASNLKADGTPIDVNNSTNYSLKNSR